MPIPTIRALPGRKSTALAVALAIAAPAEGMRQVAYTDPGGILTVCEGYTGKDIDPNKVYSIRECKALTDIRMREAVDTVERCVPGLPEHVLGAFADAVYNMGPTIACNKEKSTAARMLAWGKIQEACGQLPRWDKTKIAGVMVPLPGLTKRRNLEMRVCLNGAANA